MITYGDVSKFDTAKIECNFEMGKWKTLEVLFISLLMVPTTEKHPFPPKQN